MQNNGTGIHFHGIRQNYTNYMEYVFFFLPLQTSTLSSRGVFHPLSLFSALGSTRETYANCFQWCPIRYSMSCRTRRFLYIRMESNSIWFFLVSLSLLCKQYLFFPLPNHHTNLHIGSKLGWSCWRNHY